MEKRIFLIHVDNVSKECAGEHLKECLSKYKEEIIIDDDFDISINKGGKIDNNFNWNGNVLIYE